MTFDNSSKMESKRSHQWFMDGPEVDLLPSKKQAVEVSNNHLMTGMYSSNNHAWGDSSSFHSFNGQFAERLFDPDSATRILSYETRNIPSLGAGKLNVGRKDNTEPFGSDSSFGLSITHAIDDNGVGINYSGIRKVKVSEVKDSENVVSIPPGHAYDMGVNDTMENAPAYKGVDNPISTSLTYNKGNENVVPMDDAYGRTYNNFIPMCQSYGKSNDSLLVGQTYKEICNIMSMDKAFNKEGCNMISIAQAYKADDNSILRDSIFNKGDDGAASLTQACHNDGIDKLSVAHSYNRGESTIISFGGCDDDDNITPSGRLVSNYELLIGRPPTHKSEAMIENELVISNSDSLLSTALTSASGIGNVSQAREESKMSKKVSSNNFPSNVRSLLSTGMLDGVPVKYMAWSREELRGVIKGSGYLCSCPSCNYSKVINAYEFERHAGRKTKHPNNHIYFENGKTIYGIVQELRSTPQHMLFEVIQTITGSPINQKSFRIWKESFLAATRELQRIYGKEEMKQFS
ncbi:uncharacterized protein G2W53_023989 [Senna tora]|uniref:Tify domain-containing protein n=1 Tax=Senna tora TaxID=362788 RepID=A0A834TJA0_9FABA|nr:uncharacterized protein G2W53_023989 [Senna tora]